MNDKGYINIQGWMINKLNLRGNDLILFAVIFGFSQDGESYFTGSSRYLQDVTGTSRNTVTKGLNKLIEMGVVIKQTNVINGVPFNRFKADLARVNHLFYHQKDHNTPYQNLTDPLSEFDRPPCQNLTDPLSEFDSNNKVYNTSLNNRVNNSVFGADAQKQFEENLFGEKVHKQTSLQKEKSSAKKEKAFGRAEFRQTLVDLGADAQHVDDWIAVRASKRAPFTATALQLLFDECTKNGLPISEAVKICAGRGWQGFKYEWYLKDQNNGKQTAITAGQSRQERLDSVSRMGDLARSIIENAVSGGQAGD